MISRSRRTVPALFLAALLGAVSVPALADPSCAPMGPRGMGEHRAERFEQHQRQVHDALKLKPDQEGAWKKLVESEQSLMGHGQRAAGKPEDWASLSTPERADRMLEHMKARQAAMADHVDALKAFYAQLTPEQQKTFDDAHRRAHRAGPRGKATDAGKS